MNCSGHAALCLCTPRRATSARQVLNLVVQPRKLLTTRTSCPCCKNCTQFARLVVQPNSAQLLSLDLAQLHQSGGKQSLAPSPLQIFAGDDIDQIRDAIDARNRTTRREIQIFLDFLGEKFRPLFSFDGDSLLKHSLFRRRRSERLAGLIPEFTLTAEEGVILRTGVRHMIMRTQTAVRLLSAIPEGALLETAREVGRGAAADLLEAVVDRGRSIPESPRAFLSLWNYWDRTGGWGRYELISETEVEWRILVHNNFVHSDIGMDSRRLQRFWEGYIGGFLNHALPRISACMMRLPEKERALRVTMPAAAQVAAVRHDSTASTGADLFVVDFEVGPLSDALRGLIGARNYLEQRDFATSIVWARGSYSAMKDYLGESLDEFLNQTSQSVVDRDTFDLLDSARWPPSDAETASRCLILMNRIVQALLSKQYQPTQLSESFNDAISAGN